MNLKQLIALAIGFALFCTFLVPLVVPEPGQRAREHTYQLAPSVTLWATTREIASCYGLLAVLVVTPVVVALLRDRRRRD